MPILVQEHVDFLDNLDNWMPWVAKRGEMASHLKVEFPTLTLEESQTIVNQWLATRTQLLNEDVDSNVGC